MARQPRFFVEGEAPHIIQRGNNRDLIFAVEEDYRFFLSCLIEASHLNGAAQTTVTPETGRLKLSHSV